VLKVTLVLLDHCPGRLQMVLMVPLDLKVLTEQQVPQVPTGATGARPSGTNGVMELMEQTK